MKRDGPGYAGEAQVRSTWLWAAVVANCFLCLLLVIAACLRETTDFWRNSGGYSVLLRDAVFWLFYPALLVCGTAVAVGTWSSLHLLCKGKRPGGWLLLPCVLQALALGVALLIALWNNIENLLGGLPLHQHGL